MKRQPITAESAAALTDVVLARKLRTMSAEPRIFTDEERSVLIMQAAVRLEKQADAPVLTQEQVQEAYDWADGFMRDHMRKPEG